MVKSITEIQDIDRFGNVSHIPIMHSNFEIKGYVYLQYKFNFEKNYGITER